MDEGAPIRDALEDVLYENKVDVVFNGHVHAYERTTSVYQGRSVCDAPVYITIGDGGNHEGPACPWLQNDTAWSAHREFSFGHGVLSIKSASGAEWSWHRNQDGRAVQADTVALRPAASRCAPRAETVLV